MSSKVFSETKMKLKIQLEIYTMPLYSVPVFFCICDLYLYYTLVTV